MKVKLTRAVPVRIVQLEVDIARVT